MHKHTVPVRVEAVRLSIGMDLYRLPKQLVPKMIDDNFFTGAPPQKP